MVGFRKPVDRPPVHVWTAVLFILILGACSTAEPLAIGDCPEIERIDMLSVDAADPSLLFRLPLDAFTEPWEQASFCSSGWNPDDPTFHAAEDYFAPAGTPVYAMADGELTFSGRMGGYGWLVVVDHPGMNLYSLYGHLSPSRWTPDTGPVAKGDLVGYLGDEWENGGSRESPLVPHLHLGVRAGQRTDYPGRGEWRWMAGWISSCPADLGWLPPSQVIASQEVPDGGFRAPGGPGLVAWLPEILILGSVAIGSGWWIVRGALRRNAAYPAVVAGLTSGLGWYLGTRGFALHWVAYVLTGVAVVAAAVALARRPNPSKSEA